jgi:hypothetical protein
MFRSAVFSLVAFVLSTGFVAAETIKGRITKIDDKSVTVANKDARDGKAYDLAKDCKFYRQTKDAKEEIKEGVNAEVFKKIPDKGLGATVITNDQAKVTEVTLTGKSAGSEQSPTAFNAQPRPKGEGEMPALKLEGDWMVVYAEMDGKPADTKGFGGVTIKNNVVTCRHDGKERTWRLEFGPHHMLRCTEQIDGKTIDTGDKREPGAKGMHTHHGVYVASQDYLCVAMNKGMDKRTTGSTGSRPSNDQQALQSGQGDQGPRGSHFVLILRRSAANK